MSEHDRATRVPEWMKPNTAPITEEELRNWERWARGREIATTKTGNRMIRLINTIHALRAGTDPVTPA